MAHVSDDRALTRHASELLVASRSAVRTTAPKRVLIIGAGARGQDIAQEMLADEQHRYEVVGFADDLPDLPCIADLPVLGSFSDVLDLVPAHRIDEVIIAYTPSWQEELVKSALQRKESAHLQIRVLPGFYDAMVGDCQLERVVDIPLVRLTGGGPGFLFFFAKRIFDLLFSGLMLLLTLPILLLAALAIKLTSRGPIIFCQERIGWGGHIFRIYKLRTMVLDAERHTGPVLAHEYDTRITTVGRFLRKTRIDEIPQFWNVVKGEMSVVGPRPERPEFAREFAERIPGYLQRLRVRPGITGLAQVYGDYLTSVYHKLRYDWIYINRLSLGQEMRILFMTIGIVLGRSGT